MNLRDIILAEKSALTIGKWNTGKMPRVAFPLSKSGEKAYRLGNREWRVATFQALALDCRLLVNFSHPLSQYQAILGVTIAGDTKVLAQLELHPTHDGWHAHLACDSLDMVPSGIRRGPWVRRLKRGSAYVTRHPFTFCETDAWEVAYRTFQLNRIPPGELL